MKEINLGQITSLVHCKECGCPNEIYPSQEKINCKACGKENDLRLSFLIDMEVEHEKNKLFSDIQKHAQCIRCINRNSKRCLNEDKFLIRHCKDFVPRTERKVEQ